MLKHLEGRVIVSVDLEGKNSWRFESGQTIRYERQYNNLNRRETHPVNAIVISAKDIEPGTEILIHPNAPEEVNQLYNHSPLSGAETGSDIKLFSIPEDQCFIWKDKNGQWQPLEPYATGLRVFAPYLGILEGIEPKQLKNVLYCTSGELRGQAIQTLSHCDYEIIAQGATGREERIIRWRPFGDPKTNKEDEAIAILHDVTDKINSGRYLIGLSVSDAKQLNQPSHAN